MHVPPEGLAAIAGGGFVAIFGAAVWASTASYNRRVRANFAQLAEKFSLRVDLARRHGISARPTADGTYRGRRTQVISTVQPPRRRWPMTLILVEHRGEPIDFTIGRPLLGWRDPKKVYVATGDAAFDREFLVCGPHDRLVGALTPALRAKLLRAVELGISLAAVRAAGRELSLDIHLLLDSDLQRRLAEHMIDVLHDLADRLEKT